MEQYKDIINFENNTNTFDQLCDLLKHSFSVDAVLVGKRGGIEHCGLRDATSADELFKGLKYYFGHYKSAGSTGYFRKYCTINNKENFCGFRQKYDFNSILMIQISPNVDLEYEESSLTMDFKRLAFICWRDEAVLSTKEIELLYLIINLMYSRQILGTGVTYTIENLMAANRKAMQRELDIAIDVHRTFLPAENYMSDTVQTTAISNTAKEVGGDYYDFIESGKYLFLPIADVSGKGISASLVMSSLKFSLETLVNLKTKFDDIVYQLNRIIEKNTPPDMFITLFLSRLNLETFELTYTNLGHNNPILCRKDGTIELLKKGGVILGIFPEITFERGSVQLRKGDMLVYYTDGITDAENLDGDQFSEERLLEITKVLSGFGPEEMVEQIMNKVHDFEGDANQMDDQTLLVLKRKS